HCAIRGHAFLGSRGRSARGRPGPQGRGAPGSPEGKARGRDQRRNPRGPDRSGGLDFRPVAWRSFRADGKPASAVSAGCGPYGRCAHGGACRAD
ncbi:MAG: hypothetical protein ACK56I_19040, partial [bacterium]